MKKHYVWAGRVSNEAKQGGIKIKEMRYNKLGMP